MLITGKHSTGNIIGTLSPEMRLPDLNQVSSLPPLCGSKLHLGRKAGRINFGFKEYVAIHMNAEYLSMADLVTYASVCRNTLKKWLACGMPCYRVGSCLRVKKSEFDTWMQQYRNGTESADLDAVWNQVMEEVTC